MKHIVRAIAFPASTFLLGRKMIIRALTAFIALPGIVALLMPPLIARFDPWKLGSWAPGILIMGLGLVVLLWCVRDFYISGKGTLAPWDPPKHLVVIGLYRFVRNPMYLGVLLLVLGWGIYLCSPALLLYLACLCVGFHVHVVRKEEPWLRAQFGKQWELYRQHVSRWLPRITPWRGGI